MLMNLWGKITGADKKKALPDQQASILGRLGDYTIIYPYGLYCDLPDDVWLSVLCKGQAIPMTSSRPDSARGEIIVYHPVTGDKVHFKNDGNIDIVASSAVNVTAPSITITGNVTITGALSVSGDIDANDVVATNQDVTLSTHGHPALNASPNPGS